MGDEFSEEYDVDVSDDYEVDTTEDFEVEETEDIDMEIPEEEEIIDEEEIPEEEEIIEEEEIPEEVEEIPEDEEILEEDEEILEEVEEIPEDEKISEETEEIVEEEVPEETEEVEEFPEEIEGVAEEFPDEVEEVEELPEETEEQPEEIADETPEETIEEPNEEEVEEEIPEVASEELEEEPNEWEDTPEESSEGEDISEELPEETEEQPEETPEETEEVEELPEETEEQPEEIADETPEETMEESNEVEEVEEEIPEVVSEELEEEPNEWEDTPEESSEGEDISEELPEETEEQPEETPEETEEVEELPEETEEQPEEIADETPEETIEELNEVEETGEEFPEELPEETEEQPEELADEIPEEVPEEPNEVEEVEEEFSEETSEETEEPNEVEETGEKLPEETSEESEEEPNEWEDMPEDVPEETEEQPEELADETSEETPELTQPETFDELSDYMNSHNYGVDDYEEYSQDPEWQRLHDAAYPQEQPTDIEEISVETPHESVEHPQQIDLEVIQNQMEIQNLAENSPKLSQDAAFDKLTEYMNSHNYGADDYAEYSKDPEWQELHEAAFPDYHADVQDTTENAPELTQSEAFDQLTDYMSSHNYGIGDYPEYLQDPEWMRLHEAAFPENHPGTAASSAADLSGDGLNDETIDVAGDMTSTVANDMSEKGYSMVSASEIKGVDSSGEHFWEHHTNSKDDYMNLASKLPEVQEQLAQGHSLEEIKENSELRDCAMAYYDSGKMVQVELTENGFEFQDDGRHRVAAAQELGYEIPVNVINTEKVKEVSPAPPVEKLNENIQLTDKEELMETLSEEEMKPINQILSTAPLEKAEIIKDVNTDIVNDLVNNYNIGKADLSDFDPDVAQSVSDAVKDAKKDFPELEVNYIGSIDTQVAGIKADLTEFYRERFESVPNSGWSKEDIARAAEYNADKYIEQVGLNNTNGTFAWSLHVPKAADPTGGGLSQYNGVAINKIYASDNETFTKAKEREVATRHKPIGCDTPRATVDHELGHEIDKLLNANKDAEINRMYSEMMRNGDAEVKLSGYSKTNVKEFIAESYSEYRNNPSPREYAAKVYQRLLSIRAQRNGGV